MYLLDNLLITQKAFSLTFRQIIHVKRAPVHDSIFFYTRSF